MLCERKIIHNINSENFLKLIISQTKYHFPHQVIFQNCYYLFSFTYIYNILLKWYLLFHFTLPWFYTFYKTSWINLIEKTEIKHRSDFVEYFYSIFQYSFLLIPQIQFFIIFCCTLKLLKVARHRMKFSFLAPE